MLILALLAVVIALVACGGEPAIPTETATQIPPTSQPTAVQEPAATVTSLPTATSAPNPSPTLRPTPVPVKTQQAAQSPEPTPEATATPAPAPTATATSVPAATATPTPQPSPTATPAPTSTPVPTPTPTPPPHLTSPEAMIQSTHDDWEVIPIFTVGESIGGYLPPGILDGMGAFLLDGNTVRALVNHELSRHLGYPYELANGVSLTGARISYFDIDIQTLAVKASGLAYDTIINRYGDEVSSHNMSRDSGNVRRLCSSVFVAGGTYSLVDDIYFAGEEYGNGQLFALDVANNVLYAVPAAGRAAYENVTLVDTGDPDTVGLLIGDDHRGAPLLLYVGNKNAVGDGSFLDRNGLAQGKVYTWVADDGSASPEDFGKTGESRTGKFVEIPVLNPDRAGERHHDAIGYVSLTLQDALSFGSEELGIEGVGAHQFSRPEDLAVNPENGTQVVLNSTGSGSTFPSDRWGTVYLIDLDFSDLSADLKIIYSGDDAGNGQFPDGPDYGLRFPDNLDWADDGYVYQQEDGPVGRRSGREASIWQMNPDNGQLTRIAEVDRSAIPDGAVDTDPDRMGKWETSGVLDVTDLFGADSTVLLVNVQAHGLLGDPVGGEDADSQLVEGGQLLLLRKTN